MMECEQCKCWVHAKCEGLSNENYEILSLLPDSVEFLCRCVIFLSIYFLTNSSIWLELLSGIDNIRTNSPK